jgi:hypothetical protein
MNPTPRVPARGLYDTSDNGHPVCRDGRRNRLPHQNTKCIPPTYKTAANASNNFRWDVSRRT